MTRSIVLAALLLAGPGLASETATSTHAEERHTPARADAATTEQSPAGDRMVCERKKRIGSNRIERICMTESQRQAARERARNDLQRLGACSGSDSACGRSI